MADFQIADLTFQAGQPQVRKHQKGFRNGTVQMVNHRRLSQLHSIVAAVFWPQPSMIRLATWDVYAKQGELTYPFNTTAAA